MQSRRLEQASTINTTVPVVFQSWNDSTLTVSLTSIQMQYSPDEASASAVIRMTTVGAQMEQIMTEQWFHLFPHTLSAQAAFDKEHPVELQAELNPAIALQLAQQQCDAESILASLLPAKSRKKSRPSLACSEYWYVTEAVQQITLPPELQEEGVLKHGFRTTWRSSLREASETGSTSRKSIEPLAAVKTALDNQGLKYEMFNEDVIRLSFNSNSCGSWTTLIQLDAVKELLVLYAVFPKAVPPVKRQRISLMLMNENYDRSIGSFEMDQEDGELRYRTNLSLSAGWNEEAFQQLLGDQLQVMECYLPAITPFL